MIMSVSKRDDASAIRRIRAIHALRIRHGVACVTAARLWADRSVATGDPLAESIRRLEEVAYHLADERIENRPHVLLLIESSLAVAEQHLRTIAKSPG